MPDLSAAAPSPHNRRWLLLLLLCPVVVGIVVVLEIFTSGSAPEPVAHPASVPPGYRAITDAYFGYAIPNGWQQEVAFTDANGDIFYGGTGGWAAENLRVRDRAPGPGTDVPPQLATFGERRATPYQLSPAEPTTVAGTRVAYRYTMTRPGGFQAMVIEAWQAQSQTELWFVVHADAPSTTSILASLAGFRPPAGGAG